MSRVSERLAKIQARLDKLDDVILVELAGADGRPTLVGAVDGSVESRAVAIAEWYRDHPGAEPTAAHRREMRAGAR